MRIAGHTELLEGDGFAQRIGKGNVFIHVGCGILDGTVQCAWDILAVQPAPVLGPDVHGKVVDVGIGMHTGIEVEVFFAACLAFGSGGYEVILIQTLDVCGYVFDPRGVGILVSGSHGTGFVGYLPRQDGGVFGIFTFVVKIGTR